MSKIKVEHLSFKYQTFGDGPLVILLHGFGGGPLDWDEVIPILSKDYKVFVPNLNPLFSSKMPLSFDQQVRIISRMVKLYNKLNEKFHIVGASYGGTLSFGVRTNLDHLILSHSMINPMPFHPIKSLKNIHLRFLLLLNLIPGGINLLAKTSFGRGIFESMSRVFRMGLRGHDPITHFNDRKLRLISKALRRFRWIAKNENWKNWKNQLRDSRVPSHVMYSTHDGLFSSKEYLKFGEYFCHCGLEAIPHEGHLAIKSQPALISKAILNHVNKHSKKKAS